MADGGIFEYFCSNNTIETVRRAKSFSGMLKMAVKKKSGRTRRNSRGKESNVLRLGKRH